MGDLSNIQPDTRIRRFTNAEACEGVGTIAGFYAGSLIVQYAFGDFYIFIICASSCLVAFIYGILRIENIIPEKEIDGNDVIEVILRVTICIIHFIIQERVVTKFKKFLLIPFLKRDGFKRAQILLLCLIFFLNETAYMVDGSLMVLYTKDRFDWSQHQLMQYNTYYNALIVFGQFFCFPFLENYVKFPLMLIGCLGSMSRAGYYSMLASCKR